MTIGLSALLTIAVVYLIWSGRIAWWVAGICVAAGVSGGIAAVIASNLVTSGTGIMSDLANHFG